MNDKRKPLFDDTILHRLWTKAVGTPDYDKEEWMELEKLVHTGIITQLKNEHEKTKLRRKVNELH